MALIIWTGAVSDDINVAGNWNGGVPAGGADDIIVPETAARGMQTSMTALVNTTGSWYVHPGFKFNIGATANQLLISVGKFVDHGSGETWLKDDDGTTAEVQVNKPAGLIHLDGNTITNIRILKGHVFLDAGLGATALLEVGHAGDAVNDARVSIAVSGSTITALNQWGGHVKCGALITAATLHRGVLEQSNDNLAITTLNLYGGLCKYNSTATLATAYARGGALDLLDDAQAKVITDLWEYPGSKVIEDDGDLVTITNRHILNRNR